MENILSPRKIKAQEEKIDKKNNPNSKSPKTKREVEWRKVTNMVTYRILNRYIGVIEEIFNVRFYDYYEEQSMKKNHAHLKYDIPHSSGP